LIRGATRKKADVDQNVSPSWCVAQMTVHPSITIQQTPGKKKSAIRSMNRPQTNCNKGLTMCAMLKDKHNPNPTLTTTEP